MGDYRISGPGSQGLWTIHDANGEAIRFRGTFLQFSDHEVAADFAQVMTMARRQREEEGKRAVFAGIEKEKK